MGPRQVHRDVGAQGTETRQFLTDGRLGPERFPKALHPRRVVENALSLGVRRDHGRQPPADPDCLELMRRFAPEAARVAPGKDAIRGKPGSREGATTPWSNRSAPLWDLGHRRRNPKAIALTAYVLSMAAERGGILAVRCTIAGTAPLPIVFLLRKSCREVSAVRWCRPETMA